MADIRIEDGESVLVLNPVEKLEGVHGEIRALLSALREVEAVDRPLDLIHGQKLPGTGIPGTTAVGTWSAPTARLCCRAPGQARDRGSLGGQSYQQMIIGSADPEALLERLPTAIGTIGR